MPLNGIWAIKAPDRHTAWSRLIERYWIAKGLVSGSKSLVLGEETGAKEVVAGCMWIEEYASSGESGGGGGDVGSESEGEGVGDGVDDGRTKIAWRYERMKRFQTTVGGGE